MTKRFCDLCGGPTAELRKDHQLEKAINALKLAYARGHFCDDVPCPGCECGYALDEILGREVSQEECERFVEEQFKVKSNAEAARQKL